jgi:hypothetical protein
MKSDTDIILERSRHAASAAKWLRNSVRLEVIIMRRMREAGAPSAVVSERICTLWREYRLANRIAIMTLRHDKRMKGVWV